MVVPVQTPACIIGLVVGAALVRLLSLGLGTTGWVAMTSGSRPPHGGLPQAGHVSGPRLRGRKSRVQISSSASSSPPSSLPEERESEEGAAAAPTALSLALLTGIKLALDDSRRVDELVANFEYSGQVSVPAEGQHYEGQGAVKRFLKKLLVEHAVEGAKLLPGGGVAVTLLDSDGLSRTLELLPTSRGQVVAGIVLIHHLAVREHTASHVAEAAPLPLFSTSVAVTLSAGSDATERPRPKWETHDGRVRQKIWQHEECFALGNPFIKETMELTTGRLVAMVDETVWELYGNKIRAWADSVDLHLDPVIAPGDEDHKTLAAFTFLLDELKRTDPLRRSEPVLAIGGGVLTDTAGFACACWRRGVPWCRLPTTLLGMVDASVGIKVAINYHRKNGVGHFFSPLHTFIDSAFLGTVPLPDIRSGVGEIMKAALIHDERIYKLIDEQGEQLIEQRFQRSDGAGRVIQLSVDAMLECIGPDLWEEALLRPMDFGHSFSRTLEADERFFLRHGEAVAIDCVMSSLIAEQKGLMPPEQANSLLALYARLGLPCSIRGITAETYKRARDQITVHRDGLLRAPLPAGIGKCAYVDEMTDGEIEAAFARLEAFMAEHPETMWDLSRSFAASYAKALA